MKIKIALLLTIIAIGFHAYLTNHYYGLNYGMNVAESVCNINAKFNCDSVSASPYASFLGAPMALWGAVTNGVLLVLLLGWLLAWTDDVARLSRYTLWLAAGIAATSVVMGFISTFVLHTYCLFCIGTYLLSFANLYLIWRDQPEAPKPSPAYLRELFGAARIYLVYVLAIPLVTLLFHMSVVTKPTTSSLQRQAKIFVNEWKASNPIEFTAQPVLIKGASDADAAMTIIEFADFRCGHCKSAVPALNAFMSTRTDVQLRFYSFPLDKSCNDAVVGENGISCLLAKAVACAESTGEKGWSMHDQIFAHQDEFNRLGTLERAKDKLNEIRDRLQIAATPFESCMDSGELHERLKAMSKEAAGAGVTGTPSFFVNGRRLVGAQLLPVLEAAYSEVKASRLMK